MQANITTVHYIQGNILVNYITAIRPTWRFPINQAYDNFKQLQQNNNVDIHYRHIIPWDLFLSAINASISSVKYQNLHNRTEQQILAYFKEAWDYNVNNLDSYCSYILDEVNGSIVNVWPGTAGPNQSKGATFFWNKKYSQQGMDKVNASQFSEKKVLGGGQYKFGNMRSYDSQTTGLSSGSLSFSSLSDRFKNEVNASSQFDFPSPIVTEKGAAEVYRQRMNNIFIALRDISQGIAIGNINPMYWLKCIYKINGGFYPKYQNGWLDFM